MTLYLVHGNTYYDGYGYGYTGHTFGIFTNRAEAKAVKDLIVKKLYEEEIARGEYTFVNDISDIKVSILEIEADKLVDIELGGYCE